MAARDDLLDALFERTYARLSAPARHLFLILSAWRSLVPELALRAALLRPSHQERVDVRDALNELRRLSLAEEQVSPADGSIFVAVPLLAALFGRKKLVLHADRGTVEADLRFVQRFGPTNQSEVSRGLEQKVGRFFASVSEDLAGRPDGIESWRATLELVARAFPRAWLKIANLWYESGSVRAPEERRAALERYLQDAPPGIGRKPAWEALASMRRQENDWMGFASCLANVAELPGGGLVTASGAANTFNSVYWRLDGRGEEAPALALRLARALEARLGEEPGDPTDYSRLAWLFLNAGDPTRAAKAADSGMRRAGPGTDHCRRLRLRLYRDEIEQARSHGETARWLLAAAAAAAMPGSSAGEVSDAAQLINTNITRIADHAQRREVALALVPTMRERLGEADATFYSRLGWLLLHAGRDTEARESAVAGLGLEPGHEHCLGLWNRLR